MKIPITIIVDGKPVKVLATPGKPAVHEPFHEEIYDEELEADKETIREGWIEEVADD
ncbi:MAG: hypothetical protein ACPHEP_12775 [Acidimicrobiales bacterium]